jgi:hypothetical protein
LFFCRKSDGKDKKRLIRQYSFLYSGSERRTRMLGTGIIISERFRNSLLVFEAIINKRIYRIFFKGRFRNLYIVSTHDVLIVTGDLNAMLEKESIPRQATGMCTFHNVTSENGVMLTDSEFAVRNNFVNNSTFFLITEIILEYEGCLIQIDHVLVAAEHSLSIIDVKRYKRPNCISDHYLVKTAVREKFANVQ